MKISRWLSLALIAILLLGNGNLAAAIPPQQAHMRALPPIVRPFYAVFSAYPPRIDGVAGSEEWRGALSIDLPHGVLMLQNDGVNLYALLDITGDTTDDRLESLAVADSFGLTFDVNADGAITSGVDFEYRPAAFSTLCRAFYVGPNAFTRCGDTDSRLAVGFGTSPNSRVRHRIWELAISLPEIAAVPFGVVRMGLTVTSSKPAFTDETPPGYKGNFSDLLRVTLAKGNVALLILAHEDFVEALKPLKAHKDYTGLPTYIQSWQDLNQSFASEGRDEAERVKKAIVYYEKYCSTRFVMLVGDSNRFPVRYTMTDRGAAAAYNRAFYSADLYYACLYHSNGSYDSWDSNSDGYYGELHGETIAGTVNIDGVDYTPDIAIGRVPAMSAAEVTTYVNKVINYEFNAYKAAWAKRALLVATNDWVAGACNTKEQVAASLSGYTINKLYSTGNPCLVTAVPNAANVNAAFNNGVGFANYVGHGNNLAWAGVYGVGDMAGLSNGNTLPIVFSGGCDTAMFATLPPYDPYTDQRGAHHAGTTAGEVFSNVPPQPACIQPTDNPTSLAEHFTVRRATGAVGYIGCVTGSQPAAFDLDTSFFEAYSHTFGGTRTLGDMWRYMVTRYYQLNAPPATINPPDWTRLVRVHQPWKFHLFGDPSLRVDGVSRIQKQDFLGLYNIVWDGWRGRLELRANIDDPIEGLPNLLGTLTLLDGSTRGVRGYMRTWAYPRPAGWGPDHKIVFYIDLANTPDAGDDQRFDGYLFTRTKSVIAGTTAYGGQPYGFYAVKEGATSPSVSAADAALRTVINKNAFLGTYYMEHDGWKGQLHLAAARDDYIEQIPNITGSYTGADAQVYAVRGYVRTPTYPLPANWGPNWKIVFYIDFPRTPNKWDDDTPFEGYLFTRGFHAIAGQQWWNETPYGFYAIKRSFVHLPLLRR